MGGPNNNTPPLSQLIIPADRNCKMQYRGPGKSTSLIRIHVVDMMPGTAFRSKQLASDPEPNSIFGK